jgi:adenylate cyclase
LAPESTSPTGEEIEEQLERILASRDFRSSESLKGFLSFVVQETVAGRGPQIKAYTVATRALGRPDSFDPTIDHIVSVQAGKLRRRLEHYFLTDGADDPIRIDLPTGTYTPVFSRVQQPTPSVEGAWNAHTTIADAETHFERPSIAVLPFARIGDASETEFLAHGLTEGLIEGLTSFDGLAVVASQSTARYRDTTATTEEVSRVLGARFVLTGSVRMLESTIWVAARLIDARDSALLLWADTLQRNLSTDGLFAIEEEITRRVVACIGDEFGVVPQLMIRETRGKRPEELSAYEAVLQFYHEGTAGPTDHKRALEGLQRAVENDPQYTVAWASLAELLCWIHGHAAEDSSDHLERALHCARRAVALDPMCQQARSAMAIVHFLNHDHEEAVREAEKAIELNPNSAYRVAVSGWYIGVSGDLDRGREIIERVESLNPHLPPWLTFISLLCHLRDGDYRQAWNDARRMGIPALAWDTLLRAATAALADEDRIAAVRYRELVDLFPEVAADPRAHIGVYVHNENLVDKLLEGLDKASLAGSTTEQFQV